MQRSSVPMERIFHDLHHSGKEVGEIPTVHYAMAVQFQEKLDLLCECGGMKGLKGRRLTVGLTERVGWPGNEFDWKLLRESSLFARFACSVPVISIP